MTSWITEFSHRLNTQEACNDAVHTKPLLLMCSSDRFKTLEICEKAVEDDVKADHFKMQKMCEDDVEKDLYMLRHVLDPLKHKKCVKRL